MESMSPFFDQILKRGEHAEKRSPTEMEVLVG